MYGYSGPLWRQPYWRWRIAHCFTHIIIRHFTDSAAWLLVSVCRGRGSAAVMPPLLGHTIAEYGWAIGFRLLGAVILCLVPVALYCCGKTPETPQESHAAAARSPNRVSPQSCPAAQLLPCFVIALSVNGYVFLVPLMITVRCRRRLDWRHIGTGGYFRPLDDRLLAGQVQWAS